MENEYIYDVFISYERLQRRAYWVNKYFEPLLRDELSDCLGRQAKIFIDTSDVEGGSDWEKTICFALAKSRCLVPIFSGTYFSSKWCCREFSAVYQRQCKCGFLKKEYPYGLIVPVLIRDGKHLPEDAQSIQVIELHDYYTSSEIFRKSLDYLKFEKEIRRLANTLDSVIDRTPRHCDPKWHKSRLSDIDIKKVYKGQSDKECMLTITKPPRLI